MTRPCYLYLYLSLCLLPSRLVLIRVSDRAALLSFSLSSPLPPWSDMSVCHSSHTGGEEEPPPLLLSGCLLNPKGSPLLPPPFSFLEEEEKEERRGDQIRRGGGGGGGIYTDLQ